MTSAIYGVLLARQHKMDFVGVFCLAFVVAFGGGTLRDLFLDRHPLFWIEYDHYPIVVFAIALITSIIPRLAERSENFLMVPDALGVGLFSIAGTTAALEAGTSLFVASLLGTVTGTFGNVMGDVFCNRVPSMFRPAPLCATCSFAGCWAFILLYRIPATAEYAAPVGILVVVAFRLASVRFNWQLPGLGAELTETDSTTD